MVQQKKIILLHPTGNMNTRAALRGFFDAGILGRFDTVSGILFCIYFPVFPF